jgi:hypothetical protein
MSKLTAAQRKAKRRRKHEKQAVVNAYKTQLIYLTNRGWVPYYNPNCTALLWRNNDYKDLWTWEAFAAQISKEENLTDLMLRAVEESKILIRQS